MANTPVRAVRIPDDEVEEAQKKAEAYSLPDFSAVVRLALKSLPSRPTDTEIGLSCPHFLSPIYMSREIRRVPANWQHPKGIYKRIDSGCYVFKEEYRPMNQGTHEDAIKSFEENVKEWMDGWRLWSQGLYLDYGSKKKVPIAKKLKEWEQDLIEERKKYKYTDDYRAAEMMKYRTGICSWEDVNGDLPRYPNPDDYMPEGDWWQVFEEVSEGTPITPPFATAEELIDWMASNKDFWGHQWSRDGAEQLVKDGSAFSLIAVNEGGKVKVYEPHEQHLIKAA